MQIVRSPEVNPVVTTTKRPRGRPLGSCNKPLQDQPRSPELTRIDTQITQFLHENNGKIPLRYIAFDGHLGNIPTLEIVQLHGLHIITKLRTDSLLYLPLNTPYSGRGRPKIFGEKVDIRNIPAQYCVQTTYDGDTQTQLFTHCTGQSKSTVVKYCRQTDHIAQSENDDTHHSDEYFELAAVQLVDYYLLRYFGNKKIPSHDFSYEGIPTELVAASGFEPLTFGL